MIGAEEEKSLFESVDMANRRLVVLEHAAIDLVKEGKSEEAIMILESQEYWENKKYEPFLQTSSIA